MNGFDESFVQSCADACKMVYRLHGFESAVRYLQKSLADKVPLSYINVLSATLDMSVIVAVCSTKASGRTKIDLSQFSRRPHYIKTDVPIHQYLLEGDISVYEKEFSSHYQVTPDLFFVGQKSLLRIPLAQDEQWVTLIQFWSPEPQAFSEEQAELITAILQPLKEEIGLVGIDSLNTTAVAATYSASAGYEGMILCNDLRGIFNCLKKAAITDSSMLITGETGVGKEVVADTIYELSQRRNAPFVKINCASLPDSLIDSELFGHEKGSFTSAYAMRKGYFELADGGTLFLDEVGDMSSTAQAKLLRVLETGTFHRVGSSSLQKVDVRVIAATNRNLAAMAAQGLFRSDLYYRLNAYPVHIPPLRERPNDISSLLTFFMQLYAQKFGKKIPRLRKGDLERLRGYFWPGNVRELKHVVERAMIDFSDEHEYLRFRFSSQIETTGPDLRKPREWPTLAEMTDRYIQEVLQHTGGKVYGPGSASAILGIHYTTLRAHMKKLQQRSGDAED